MSKLHNLHIAKWQRLRKKILERNKYICTNPFKLHSGVLKPAEEVHHILTADNHPQYFFNAKNLCPLCVECHKYAHFLLRTDPIKYFDYFKSSSRGVSDFLQPFLPSPHTPLLPEVSNAERVDCKTHSKCFKDFANNRYYCECLRRYKTFPCSKCNHLTQN